MELNDLTTYLAQILQPERFNDYCPNGLQVEGRREVRKIVTGVTANKDLIDAAISRQADLILVHHGYFWRGESQPIVGMKKRRIQALLTHDISLMAYHLPLDAHPEFGNNVMLGKQLGLEITRWLDDKHMLAVCDLPQAITLGELCALVQTKLGRTPQLIGQSERHIRTVAWCTGAAQGYIDQAIEANVDVYISGEISEQTVHSVRESSTSYISAGHHVTERYGVAALGEHLAKKWGILHEFIEIYNPV